MLTQLLMFGAPLLWLTLTAVVVAACRAAGRADTMAGAPGGPRA